MERNYPGCIIISAISRARNIPRSVAFMKLSRNNTSSRRPVFVIFLDPRLPSVSNITNKHWRSMTQDPPIITYRRRKNIGDLVPKQSSSQKEKSGMKKCKKNLSWVPICTRKKISKRSKIFMVKNYQVYFDAEHILN